MIESESFEAYEKRPSLNQSKLGALKKCPQKYKWLAENQTGDTDSLRMGRAIHTAVLEPDSFNQQFLCLPEIDRRTVKGRELYNDLVAQNPDKTLLKPDQFSEAMAIATAVRTNSHVLKLLDGATVESSVEWTDEATGVVCKARIDAYNEKLCSVIDLKTTVDASPDGFPRKLWAYGYHRQAAWYLEALRANDKPAEHFVFIAVEKEPPYCLGLYRLADEALRLSKLENDALLRRYVQCVTSNSWCGYTNGIEDISIPQYGANQLEEQHGEESI